MRPPPLFPMTVSIMYGRAQFIPCPARVTAMRAPEGGRLPLIRRAHSHLCNLAKCNVVIGKIKWQASSPSPSSSPSSSGACEATLPFRNRPIRKWSAWDEASLQLAGAKQEPLAALGPLKTGDGRTCDRAIRISPSADGAAGDGSISHNRHPNCRWNEIRHRRNQRKLKKQTNKHCSSFLLLLLLFLNAVGEMRWMQRCKRS